MRAARACRFALFLVIIAAVSALRAGAQSASGTEDHAATREIEVSGELIDKLDAKTAKTGDPVVIKTKSAVHIVGGVEIPKGSKLIGHVTGVAPVGAATPNSQIAVAFDHVETKDGQSFSVQAEITSLGPVGGDSNPSADSIAASPGATPPGHAPGDMYGSTPTTIAPSQMPHQAQPDKEASAVHASGPSSNGSVVAHSGGLIIRATGLPGVLLTNHEATSSATQLSSILLGAGHNIVVETGTPVVVGLVSTETAKSAAAD